MLDRIALLDSQVIRALIVALIGVIGIVCSFFGIDEALFSSEKAQKLADGVATLLTLGGVVWAGWSRATKPSPPLTQKAASATEEAVAKGDLTVSKYPEGARGKQGGFLRPLFAVFLVAVVLAGALGTVAGCTGTRDAYQTAAHSEQRLSDTAYVITEHYAAVLKQAADLKESGRLPPEVVAGLQRADLAVAPIIRGDAAAGRPSLRDLAAAFERTKSAQTEQELQAAIDDAVRLLADFSRAVTKARP